MAGHLDGMADPDDTRWQDQDRYVGDGVGAEQVRSGCRVSLAIGGASVLGLAVVIGAAYLAVSP